MRFTASSNSIRVRKLACSVSLSITLIHSAVRQRVQVVSTATHATLDAGSAGNHFPADVKLITGPAKADRFFLGIDGGGTRTVALLSSDDGHILRRIEAGPANVKLLTDAQLVA